MFDWQKDKKENLEVEPDKMVEQQQKAEQMYENLRRSSDGENFKVEEEKSVMGQRRRFNITDRNGAKTDVDITENAQVEVRGEQKEVRNVVERGEKISNVNPVQEGVSAIQQDVVMRINSSHLSDTEKQQLRDNVEKHNFADKQQSNEQYTQEIQSTINAKEDEKTNSAAKVNDVAKIMILRGLDSHNSTLQTSTRGRSVNQSLANMAYGRRPNTY